VVDKWLKREGESFKSGESLCEVSISGFSLAIDQPTHGIVAEIIANDGKTVDTDHPIASFVLNTEEYLEFVEAKRLLVEDSERMESTKEVQDEKTKKPDTMVLMREIKHLIQHGEIEEGSGEYIYHR
jgi:pyruvate/2-oxoglutarate dehydrogenase complex dihydrolipoamide acyltransferase (E2) component